VARVCVRRVGLSHRRGRSISWKLSDDPTVLKYMKRANKTYLRRSIRPSLKSKLKDERSEKPVFLIVKNEQILLSKYYFLCSAVVFTFLKNLKVRLRVMISWIHSMIGVSEISGNSCLNKAVICQDYD
jgi:hypothetical protein